PRLLSQFFFADERVTRVVAEINGLDAELDPQQYLVLLNQLHLSQAHLLAVLERIMEECIPTQRHSRDYLVKFPEELLVDNLGNHMLFAAELHLGYLTQEMIDGYEPLLMFTIPRLAIISGLLIYPEGPLSLERSPEEMSRVFSPFYNLLKKIRDLLRVLSAEELCLLERSLCTAE
ncbi:LST2 protein, partial [Erythrocercus mccallii]|nr:LST2 protein [Erythrocercus mccallii]